ncbi:putative quinol monooxygenase [Microbispora siamensis]
MDFFDGGVEPQGPAQSVLTTPGTDDKYAHPTIVAAVGRLPFSGGGERQVWRSQEDFDRHNATPLLRAFTAELPEHVDGTIEAYSGAMRSPYPYAGASSTG